MSNEDLLKHYSEGCFEAFDEFFQRNSQIVYSFIAYKVPRSQDADDILQETFFRLHKYIHRYDPSRSALNWVFSIAKNQIWTFLLRSKEGVPFDETTHSHDQNPNLVARDQLLKLLRNLTQAEQSLIIDKFIHEYNYEEIALKQGEKAINLRKKISRILKKLRLSNQQL